MSNTFKLSELPTPFYRVAIKALIFDEQNRLLMFKSKHNEYEVPGGGWEHGETPEACLSRELKEEGGAELVSISVPVFVFNELSEYGWWVARIVVRARIKPGKLTPGDGMVGAMYVTKDEFLSLEVPKGDESFKKFADQIWSAS